MPQHLEYQKKALHELLPVSLMDIYQSKTSWMAKEELINNLNDAKLNILYHQFVQTLNAQIAEAEKKDVPFVYEAKNLLTGVLKQFDRNTNCIDTFTLFNLMSIINKMLKTPMLNEQNQMNPAFIAQVKQLQMHSAILTNKKKTNFNKGLISALIAAAFAGAAIATGVILGSAYGLGIIVGILCGAKSATWGLKAYSLFSKYNQQRNMVNLLNPLIEKVAPNITQQASLSRPRY